MKKSKKEWDRIYIKNLEVFARHGVYPEENKLGQKFLVNAVLYTHTRKAGLKDDLTKSVHYGEAAYFMDAYMKEHTFQLIETAAEQMARAVLLQFPNLEGICLEIAKPWAPVGLPLESVSVEIERSWHRAFVAVGSNLGERENHVEQAIQALDQCEDCRVEQVSNLIVTEPYGVTDQPEFLNGMIELRTLLEPEELLEQLHKIEQEAGRERLQHWGPRTLDLDIIFYDHDVIDLPRLQIPHSDMQNREFVLEPLAELAPYIRHPLFLKTAAQMLEELRSGKIS
ncbi:MAG: 2-amino-4-hydroxy-6-hydroxymethyldihydropteridine diphosphokinase [Lachnospiraceae bacterium]|nr:2-amino-4-hydroxy-6-hydroxymethyldihydropteridine diphosphokinase [Lachnospiraceae bacterium]